VSALLGEQIGEWLLRRVDPNRIYDHRILHELSDAGIGYDDDSHLMWLLTGEVVEVTTYSPAELMKHPHVQFRGLTETESTRWIPGFEIAHWLHLLLWPLETPPGDVRRGWTQAYTLNVTSISERELLPYRGG
jgi:hypothetical protein